MSERRMTGGMRLGSRVLRKGIGVRLGSPESSFQERVVGPSKISM